MSAELAQRPVQAMLLAGRFRNIRALWVVLVIMSFLAGIALLFARGTMRLSSDWHSQLNKTMNVQILLDSEDMWASEMEIARDVLSVTLPGADFAVLSQDETRELLEPWLGQTALPSDLPIPGMITITGTSPDKRLPLEDALNQAGISATIRDNRQEAHQLRMTARRLIAAGIILLSLTLIAGLAVNIFATRASLIAQQDIIRVLVQVGASDPFIARLFLWQAGQRGAIGAAIGMGLALVIWFILGFGGEWDGGLGWNRFGAAFKDLLWLAALGIVFALICAGAAGITVLRQLSTERKRL